MTAALKTHPTSTFSVVPPLPSGPPGKTTFYLPPECDECCSPSPEEETKAVKGKGLLHPTARMGPGERIWGATLVPETPPLLVQPLSHPRLQVG